MNNIVIDQIPVTVDGVEYKGEDLSPDAQAMLRHVVDLRDKRASLEFQMDQVRVAEHAFIRALEETVRKDGAEVA